MPEVSKNNADIIRKLANMCIRWGGLLINTTERDIKYRADEPDFYEAPFANYLTLGINYKQKEIYYTDTVPWPSIVHEMGHVFASRLTPNKSDEWVFFGWEYLLSRKIGTIKEWKQHNLLYVLNDKDDPYLELGDTTNMQLKRKLKEAIEIGKRYGNLNSKNQPRNVRDKAWAKTTTKTSQEI